MRNKQNKLYFIGDIHGCIDTLKIMTEDKLKPEKDDTVVFMGDYIDRGKDSKAVLDELILYEKENRFTTVFLRGNHEDMMLKSLSNTGLIPDWKKNGGDKTLLSFGAETPYDISDKYINFLKKTKFFYKSELFTAVHAGMNFDIHNPFFDFDAMLWRRNKTINKKKINGTKLIVAHTPVTIQESEQSLNTDKIMIDGGCVYSDKIPFLGNLIAFDAINYSIITVRNKDE